MDDETAAALIESLTSLMDTYEAGYMIVRKDWPDVDLQEWMTATDEILRRLVTHAGRLTAATLENRHS